MLLSVAPIWAADGYSVTYTENTALTLLSNPTTCNEQTSYYRIPAITLLQGGSLLAFSDLRIGGTGDIGGGNAISIVTRKSDDGGKTWSNEVTAITGGADDFDFAHGDAAVVTDRESGKTLLLCASGTKGYSAGGCQLGRYYSEDGSTWSGEEITSQIKAAFDSAHLTVTKQFFTSGRIIQSARIKVGSHYRIYSALCTGSGSIVLYSDDFGATWTVLGNAIACKGGDETILEELPNGDLLLSARLGTPGRKFNVFAYTDLTTGTGAWNSASAIALREATNCNAEMLLLPTQQEHLYILLHSAALSGRTKVSLYYKVIDTRTDAFSAPTFYTDGWTLLQQLSTTTSCYSTMVADSEGNVALLFEENSNGGYDIQYRNFSISLSDATGINQMGVIPHFDLNTYNLLGQRVNFQLAAGGITLRK